MADFEFEAPSFSLGLDFDLDSEPQPTPRPGPLFQPAKRLPAASNLQTIDENDDDFESPVRVSIPVAVDPPRTLKRLRRGPASPLVSEAGKVNSRCNVDDEIEDFSSEEDCPRGKLSTHSICSSSRSSLHAQKVLTSELGNQLNSRKKKEISRASTSTNEKTISRNLVFPELTVSPLRRFQLIDSDSDDLSVSEYSNKEVLCSNSFSMKNQASSSKSSVKKDLKTEKTAVGKYQNEDLWKNFGPAKSCHIPTPAFDEVFEEYFTSAKNITEAEVIQMDAGNDTEWLLPAHSYFFHKDTRIQNLVRDRLPNFFPLGEEDNQGYHQKNSVIDYMGQFGYEENSRQSDRKKNLEKSSKGTKKNGKSQVDNISLASENWVNPKSGAGVPKDAGKRRVQAASKSGGHWYTDSDGKRVYVKKNGQQLTGRNAYRDYKKDSGGFRKKKTAAKKKSAPKRK